jgi:murein DD-endopeptidase MepM/ murein hydrolase activator NlpD
LTLGIYGSFFFPVTHLKAQTADELRQDLDGLSKQITDLDNEIKAFSQKINQTKGEAKTLRQALLVLENKRTLLLKEIKNTSLRIEKAEQNISFTEEKIHATESVLERNKKALSESLRRFYYDDVAIPKYIFVLKDGGTLSSAIDSYTRNTEVSNAISERVQALVDTKLTLDVQKKSYEQHKENLEVLNNRLANQKETVEITSKDKNKLLKDTQNKESVYQNLLAERKKKKNELESEMSDIEAKLKTIVDVSKLPKYGKGILKYPLDTVRITQYFGNTPFSSKNPQVYNGAGHNGIDFGVPTGTTLYSAESGTVIGVGDTDTACSGASYGKWVLIRHNNGLSTLYAHMSSIHVREGDSLTQRQKIGLSGNTGYSTGPHLHFTVFASDAVQITNHRSRACGTIMRMPIAPRSGYLNPLSYL